MPTLDDILDYYNNYNKEIPQSIYDIADTIFDIGDDDDIPEAYYVWIGRQLMLLEKGGQL